MKRQQRKLLIGGVIAIANATCIALAYAQPTPPPNPANPTPPSPTPTPPTPTPTPASPTPPPSVPNVPTEPAPGTGATAPDNLDTITPYDEQVIKPANKPSAPDRFDRPAGPPAPPLVVDLPEVLTTPTGFLLPGGVIYKRSGIDTGGGISSDLRIGLGDVAEFGIAITDQVRGRASNAEEAKRIAPYVTASFRLGLSEHRLFRHQPAITLGYRKSFERNKDGFGTKIAELTLVASKHLGKRTMLHLGGSFWDAQVGPSNDESQIYYLHDQPLQRALRVFGGVSARATNDADILIDLGWAPDFCYGCTDKVKLRALLSWGVRYHISDWVKFDSGVRISNIQDANLLDAQIFGNIVLLNGRIRNAIRRMK